MLLVSTIQSQVRWLENKQYPVLHYPPGKFENLLMKLHSYDIDQYILYRLDK